MKARLLTVGLAALLAFGPVAAEARSGGFFSGNDLYTKCVSTDPSDSMVCLGYVQGASDATISDLDRSGKKQICLPHGVTAGQLRDVVMKYIQNTPEVRHFIASDLVLVSLGVAFPCPR